METLVSQSETVLPRDAAYWAPPISTLSASDAPEGAINLNVEGRQVVGALQGFGQLWQKTYRVRLCGAEITPTQVMEIWKSNFARFQPADNHFHPSVDGVRPGEVMFVDTMLPVVPGLPGLIPMASGVMILYADESSFTVMTPEGFPVAGWNTFSAYEEDGCTVAQVQSLERSTDPIYEFGFRLMGGARKQEQTWQAVLTALATHLGVEPKVETERLLLDPQMQWAYAKNVWHNAGVRTTLYQMTRPLRWLRRAVGRRLAPAAS